MWAVKIDGYSLFKSLILKNSPKMEWIETEQMKNYRLFDK